MSKKKQIAFLALYEPVHEKFERFCRARVYGDMDHKDLINETLLKAYEKFDTLKSEQAFLSFLFSIAVRVLANSNRKKKEETNMSSGAYAVKDVNSDTSLRTEVAMLYEAMRLMDEKYRESLILFEITGFSIKEIAEIQATSESNVKQRLRRARLQLKHILSDSQMVNNRKEVEHAK